MTGDGERRVTGLRPKRSSDLFHHYDVRFVTRIVDVSFRTRFCCNAGWVKANFTAVGTHDFVHASVLYHQSVLIIMVTAEMELSGRYWSRMPETNVKSGLRLSAAITYATLFFDVNSLLPLLHLTQQLNRRRLVHVERPKFIKNVGDRR